jgi:hypothetical protein
MAGRDAPPAADAFRTRRPLPDIRGLVLRHLRAPDDYGPMNAIANATRAATGVDLTTTPEQMRNHYEHPSDFDSARDVAVVELEEPTDEDYERYLTDPVESDTSLWRVAWDGDEVAGQVRSYINPVEERAVWAPPRLYREHQRPPAVAPSRSGAGADRRKLPAPSRSGHDGGRPRGRYRERLGRAPRL